MTITNKVNLLRCYNNCLEIARNDFCSPDIFVKEFIHQNKIVIIDLMNMCLINSEKIRPSYLWSILHELYDENMHINNFDKDRREYSSFSFFLKNIKVDEFKKFDKPDFFIKISNIVYDLEIRSVLLEDDAKLNKIGMMQFGRSKNESDFIKYLSKNFKRMNWQEYYKNYNGVNVLHSPTYDCNHYLQQIIDAIIRKNNQVDTYKDNYDKWLLIDTESNICISDQNDIDRLESEIVNKEDKISNLSRIFIINKQEKLFYNYEVRRKT